EAEADRAGARMRRARHGGPVDLARVAGLEGPRERRGRPGAAAHDEHPRSIAVEAVDELRLLLPLEAQRLGQGIDMPDLARAPLDRKSRRLVERDNMLVPIDDGRADHFRIIRTRPER